MKNRQKTIQKVKPSALQLDLFYVTGIWLLYIYVINKIASHCSVVFEEPTSRYDHTGKTAYVEACRLLGVVPASFFLRHMHDATLTMKHHGLGMLGMKAIAMSLVVSV